ncbi:MAG: FtsW/RodA/SpoVE family cell cycle protein, partial [Synergistaceae bacterium]|nr:FtsW/RodA/SpoVE family cell cycle protein [Synergistaceae bacterium]
AILIAPYRMRRFNAFWDPWSDPTNTGFQIIQGLVAFAIGSVTGVGIGKGLQQERYLPEADTDYIFPAIGEEFGLVGTLFLVILYAVWTWKVFFIYKNAKNPFTKSHALGLTASVIFPMFVNVAGVTKLMPLTGIPMPFISAGGRSMLFMWAKVGLLMAIKSENSEDDKPKHKHKKKTDEEIDDE